MHEQDEHTQSSAKKSSRQTGANKRAVGKRQTGASKPTAGKAASDKDNGDTQASRGGDAGKRARAPRRGASGPRIKPAPDPRTSRSLEYGVAILESFSGKQQTLGISALSKIVGISRSTIHRYATTLVVLGYLEQDAKRKYRLSTRAASPGGAAVAAVRRQVHARAVLEELREQTGHTVSMGVLDRTRVIYVYRLFGHRPGQYAIDADRGVGANVPVHCTSLGKVLLASLSDAERRELLAGLRLTRHGPNTITDRDALAVELDRISPRSVVVSDEELIRGSRSIAMLVPRPSGEHPLAIDVTVPSAAFTVERLAQQVGPHIKRAARLIAGE